MLGTDIMIVEIGGVEPPTSALRTPRSPIELYPLTDVKCIKALTAWKVLGWYNLLLITEFFDSSKVRDKLDQNNNKNNEVYYRYTIEVL